MSNSMNRREFMGHSARAVASSCFLVGGVNAVGAEQATTTSAEQLIWRNKRPTMAYQRLGRTNFMTSRLAFGAGGLYSGGGPLRLLEEAIDAGVNYIDTGRPYRGSEAAIAPVIKKHAGKIWITSKAGHIGWPDMQIKPGQDAEAAKLYTDQLEESLKALETDHIDCYMVQGVEHEWVVKMDSLYEAFQKAKQAGKVSHFGLATHTNVERVCLTAAQTGRYDVIMPSVHPGSVANLRQAIEAMRKAGIGLVNMKTGGAVRKDKQEFEKLYESLFAGQELSAYQRAQAYMLHRGGMDAFNSHMTNFTMLRENLAVPLLKLSLAELDLLESAVMAEAAGACHHCAACKGVCPAGLDPAAALRYYAYGQHYSGAQAEQALCRTALLGCMEACRQCGACGAVCAAGVDLPLVVGHVRAQLV
ncbi:MAG TPA: aldo/keto reductase [Phycisphaerae bacterium]|nr:aldo/keto reductase [Phycisphaerae bacterium]